MDVLVIGGSVFLGRAVVEEALAREDRVTVFNRGLSGAANPAVTQLVGDRTVASDLARLEGRRFDLVVDTCGYVPVDVRASAELLAAGAGHYAFVSTVNVYPGWPEQPDYHPGGVYAGDPDADRGNVPEEFEESQAYGWLKTGCEQAVLRAFGDARASVLRAGCIVGPWDAAVGRLPWWVDRVARGGEVLVPGRPDDGISLLDARDLARFALDGAPGVFETPGPTARDTRAELMAACAAATGADVGLTWVEDEQWLADHGVQEWTELPLWGPRATMPSTFVHDGTAAERAGLRWRPLAETVADTWAWQRNLDERWRPSPRTPGLAPERERELLAAWHAR